jgi:tetratricopeptide (TPR) repeat protein
MRVWKKTPYATAFVFTIAAIAPAAAYTFWLMRPGPPPAAESPDHLPLETGDAFDVKNVGSIRPRPEAYVPFAEEDRRWREDAVARMFAAMRTEGPDIPWRASAEQVLDDSVYFLARAERYAEAAELLVGWLDTHPDDIDRQITTARLLAQTRQMDESFARYQTALRARPTDRELRTEYAETLLWAGWYPAAVEEFRKVAVEHPDPLVQLRLAQALAWSNRAGEAEPLLTRLSAQTPGDTALRVLLRSTRANLLPSSATAERWIASDPLYWPYRLALSRAYAGEGRYTDAGQAFDRVLADSVSVPLLTEAAGVRAAAGDSTGTALLRGRAVALAPEDVTLREQYAQSLAWAGERRRAIAEYTRLIAVRDDAERRLARGQLYFYLREESAALVDLERSAQMRPTYDALSAVGDLYRWRGDYRRSREAYNRALEIRGGDSRVLAALTLLRAAERAALAQTDVADEPGWTFGGSYAEDNAGFLLLRARLAFGFTAGSKTNASLGIEQRRVSFRTPREPEKYLQGYSVEGAVQHFFKRLQVGVGGGVARHALVADMPFGHALAAAALGPVMFTMRVASGPAYPDLWSFSSLFQWNTDEGISRPMRARSLRATAGVPVGRGRVEFGAERMSLADGNQRRTVSVTVRQPLTRSVRIIYAAGSLNWSNGSPTYWDPRNYTHQAVGIEAERNVGNNLSVAARALAGVARTTERVPLAPGAAQIGSSWAPQFSGGVDATYRRKSFDVTAGAGYGRGAPREGGVPPYQALTGSLRIRIGLP